MNLLTIIILLVLLVFAINGYMRGFARTLTSLLFFVFSGVLVYYSTPYVNDFLKTQTPVYSFVESKCETLVEDAIMDKLDKETQKEMKKNQELIDHYDYLKNAASSTDCTGLIPALPESEDELDAYNDVYQYQTPLVKPKS